MSKEKLIHDLVFLYDKATLANVTLAGVQQDSLADVTINDIPLFEQRCSIMAWHIAHMEYIKEHPTDTYQTFVNECIGTVAGLAIYQTAFDDAQNKLDKELTIAKLIKFQETGSVSVQETVSVP